jgi:hypothetical protein
MPVLEGFARFGPDAAGFVVPLFAQRPGANLLQMQRVDERGRVADFEDIAGPPSITRYAEAPVFLDIGEKALWGFADARGTIHLGDRSSLRALAPTILTASMIRRWPASAADLIQFCGLDSQMAEKARQAYAAMAALSPTGAAIWRDADLMLPVIRASLGSRRIKGARRQMLLDHVFACTRDGVCHVHVPDELFTEQIRGDITIRTLASAWGIDRVEFHPFRLSYNAKASEPSRSWPVIGLGGVGRYTVNRMWNAIGPMPSADVRSRLNGFAVEAQLRLPTAPLIVMPCPDLRIIIHGSARRDVDTGSSLIERSGPIQHVFNIRPLGLSPERPDFIAPWRIVQDRGGPDFLWVIANHRQRRVIHRMVGMAMSQVASRFTRAGITALADLSQSARGRELLKETAGAHAMGLVGAARFLKGPAPEPLLTRALYSMLSPEWTFVGARRIVALWPRPVPEGSIVFITLGGHNYPVELIGVEHSSARADVRCLAFDVRERPADLAGYADFLVSILAGWDWQLRSDIGEEMIFEEQGLVISVYPAETRARLDALLDRPSSNGSFSEIIVVNRPPTPRQQKRIDATQWTVIHHADLPTWLRERFGEPAFSPIGGRSSSDY